jgi:hypothetical protein
MVIGSGELTSAWPPFELAPDPPADDVGAFCAEREPAESRIKSEMRAVYFTGKFGKGLGRSRSRPRILQI